MIQSLAVRDYFQLFRKIPEIDRDVDVAAVRYSGNRIQCGLNDCLKVYKTEGIGEDFLPTTMDFSVVDDVVQVTDKDAMLAMLAPDATFVSDGGGKRPAITRTLEGPDRITRFFLGLERKYPGLLTHAITELNGQSAIASYHDGVLQMTTSFETDGDRILAVYRVLNPDKLAHLR